MVSLLWMTSHIILLLLKFEKHTEAILSPIGNYSINPANLFEIPMSESTESVFNL